MSAQEAAAGRKSGGTAFEQALCAAFPSEWLRKTAEKTGLIKRERKIDPVPLFWVLVFSYGVHLQRSLAALKRNYEKGSGGHISDSSWYDRFTPELVAFLKKCVVRGIEHFSERANHKLSEKLAGIKDVLIQDSTIIRLHKFFAKKWPAARTRKVAAGVKVSVLVSAVADGPKRVAIFGERTSELKTLRIGPWVKDRVLLIDLGFYKHQLFARIHENGGYFVSRLKGTADPLITAVNGTCRGNSVDVAGKKLSEVIPKLKRHILDVVVEIPFKRRGYGGKSSGGSATFRMVAVYNDEDKKYHTYITNIGCDKLCAEDVAGLYGVRWAIELIFSELKNKYALDKIATKNQQVVEAYIWMAILTLFASRIIYHVARQEAAMKGYDVVRYTKMRWSTIFCENAGAHLARVLAHCGFEMSPELIADICSSQALDPHVNRHRLMDGWLA